jgi:FMN phosphatase YigB (HAD superfamily)
VIELNGGKGFMLNLSEGVVMIKNNVISKLFLVLLLTAGSMGYAAQYEQRTKVIAVDVDDVVAETSKWEKAKVFAAHWRTIGYLFYPAIAQKVWQHRKENPHDGAEGWMEWSRQNQIGLETFIRDMQDSKGKIEGTIKIIQELRANGYKVVAATNMGVNEFMRHCQPGGILHGVFEECGNTTTDYRDLPIVIKKPNPEFFTKKVKENIERCFPGAQLIAFIDDKKKNTDAAQKTGMFERVIVFKNPEQLRSEMPFELFRQ